MQKATPASRFPATEIYKKVCMKIIGKAIIVDRGELCEMPNIH